MTAQDVEQRLLVMVTDGMLSEQDIEELSRLSAEKDLEFIAMIIAAETATTPLLPESSEDRLKILIVDDILRMPVLMREEIESRRPAVVQQRVHPVAGTLTMPGDVATDWPALNAYALTRARPEATSPRRGRRSCPPRC